MTGCMWPVSGDVSNPTRACFTHSARFNDHFSEWDSCGMAVLLLDANLWSYLGATHSADEVDRLFVDAGHEVVISPQMLSEALQTKDVDRRTATVELMCSPHWRKLPSILDAQSVELASEVKRLRPDWYRRMPKTDRFHSFRAYWTKVFWREARKEPEVVIARMAAVDRNEADEILRVQEANKAVWPFADGDLESAALSACCAEDHPDPDDGSRLGWPDGVPVLWWRVTTRDVFWTKLVEELDGPFNRHRDTTLSDSLGAFTYLTKMRHDREGFNRFFLFDVDGWNVPRLWWSGTIEVMQLGAKIGRGNPMDVAHAAYLPDCDYFLTADATFARLLRLASDVLGAPRGGLGIHVKPHPDGWFEAIRAQLASLPAPRRAVRARVIPDGPGVRIGDGADMVSGREFHERRIHGRPRMTHEGNVRVLSLDGQVVAARVPAVFTNIAEARPVGVDARWWGEFQLSSEALPTSIAPRTEYDLLWSEMSDAQPIRAWIREISEAGAVAFTVKGNPAALSPPTRSVVQEH